MAPRLFDTGTRTVRAFVPVRPGEASLYVCGATVQGPPHIGHVRSGVNFDILARWPAYTDDKERVVRLLGEVRAVLGVLGLDPLDPHGAQGRDTDAAGPSSGRSGRADTVGALVEPALEERRLARAARDYAAEDRIRDRLGAAGVELEDTPAGPRWALGGRR